MSGKGSLSSASVSTIEKMGIQEEGAVGNGAKKGLSFAMTSFFLVAQMAGAGFLSLPKALSNTGWIGVPMMIIFCISVGFSGTKLGECWVMLEERWPQDYVNGCRQPYMEIAERALGKHGRRLTLACVMITLFGGSTVFLILAATFMHNLVDTLSTCEWVLIVAVVLLPFTWLGTPKDFWQASVLAVITTALACIVIFIELLIEAEDFPNPIYQNPTLFTFSLGFGAILFAFGGASVFPTIQNDMENRTQFGRSVVVSFIALLTLYLPVTIGGYAVQGIEVESIILLSVDTSKGIVIASIVMEVINLLGTYVITFNPVSQTMESLLNIDNKFGLKRIILRSSIVAIELLIGLAVPSFDKILNLIGGSTVTVCSFVLPPLMYMRLVDMKNMKPEWPVREIVLWERILLWMIISVGVVGGLISTVTAFMDILNPDSFSSSCFVDFTGSSSE